jgi:hypothetical protein
MEWVAVITWGLVVAVALPLARGASFFPPLGLQAIAGVAGLALCVVFLAVDDAPAVAWGAVAAAVVGLISAGVGAVWLMGDGHAVSGPAQQHAEELDASLEGVELPLFGLVATFALLMALGVATVG